MYVLYDQNPPAIQKNYIYAVRATCDVKTPNRIKYEYVYTSDKRGSKKNSLDISDWNWDDGQNLFHSASEAKEALYDRYERKLDSIEIKD